MMAKLCLRDRLCKGELAYVQVCSVLASTVTEMKRLPVIELYEDSILMVSKDMEAVPTSKLASGKTEIKLEVDGEKV